MKVYLAGGFHSNWQERIMRACPDHQFFNPKTHLLKDATNYTVWDKVKIQESDIIFAYYETDNPSGIGLAFEAGYAMGLGKTVLFVCEKEDRYALILIFGTTIAFSTLDDGIALLRSLQ